MQARSWKNFTLKSLNILVVRVTEIVTGSHEPDKFTSCECLKG